MKCNNCKYFHCLELGKYCGAKGEYLENEDYSNCKGFKEREVQENERK